MWLVKLSLIFWISGFIEPGALIAQVSHANATAAAPPWIRKSSDTQADGVIVFVHGVLGNTTTTWSNGKSYWPELLTHDKTFDGQDIYVYGYPSPQLSKTLSIDEVAENLRLVLATDGVLRYKTITFLCHSMGGLVVRAFLVKYQSTVAPKVRFVYFFGTPTTGSPYATLASIVSKNSQFGQMYPISSDSYLGPLQSNWLAAHLNIKSYCGYETESLLGRIVVDRQSATNLCTERLDPIDANHINLVKPLDGNSTPYRAFKSAFEETTPHRLIGRVLDASSSALRPVQNVTVVLANTGQTATTGRDGQFQLSLLPSLRPGSEARLNVRSRDLRIYSPPNGVFTLPAAGQKPLEVQLLPVGSKSFLGPARVEALLAEALKHTDARDHPEFGQGGAAPLGLEQFLKSWASEYGFTAEEVERAARAWGNQVRSSRDKASDRQRALAEFEAHHFEEAAGFFESSASAAEARLETLERDRKEREREEKDVLRGFVDDKIGESEALAHDLKYESAASVMEAAVKRIDRNRYPELWADMEARWGVSLYDVGAVGEGANSIASFRSAISAYESALQVRTKQALPQDWAKTQNNLGNAYLGLGERLSGPGSLLNLRSAVSCFESAIGIQTIESAPKEWAAGQNNLGVSFWRIAERGDALESIASLEKARVAFENALRIRTREATPEEWAGTQHNLGNLYQLFGERFRPSESIKYLRASLAAYQDALTIRTKETFGLLWAATQNNMGNTYQKLGERLAGSDAIQTFHDSIEAYQKALEVRSKSSVPQLWAATQNNLGNTRMRLASLLPRNEAVELMTNAIAGFKMLLAVRPKNVLPQDWANTQNNLGVAYLGLGDRSVMPEALQCFQNAKAAFQDALLIHTKEASPQDWANAKDNLGVAYTRIADQTEGVEASRALIAAIAAFEQALEIRTINEFPQPWAGSQGNLGVAHVALGQKVSRPEAILHYRAALGAFDNALKVRTKESLPQNWAEMNLNSGGCNWVLGEELRGPSGTANLDEAFAAFKSGASHLQAALEIFDKTSHPDSWAGAYKMLGLVYRSLGQISVGVQAEEYLQKAVDCFQLVLTLYSREYDLNRYADIQDLLAQTFSSQRKWREAAAAEEEYLLVFPNSVNGLSRAEGYYHDRLYDYGRAFELNAKRVQLGQGEVDFVEKHLTTARFDGCITRAEHLQTQISDAGELVVLESLYFACLRASHMDSKAGQVLEKLRSDLQNVQSVDWSFNGTKHFVTIQAPFSDRPAPWVRLFEAIEERNTTKFEMAYRELRSQ